MAKDKKPPTVKEQPQAVTDIELLENMKAFYTTEKVGEKNKQLCSKIKSLLSAAQQHIGNIKIK